MPHIEQRVTIERPIEDVWGFLVNLFNAPRYQSDFFLGMRSPGLKGVGSTAQARVKVLGFETRMDFEVTEWEPPSHIAIRITGGPFRSGFRRVTLTPTASGTEYFASTDIELRGFLRLMWPIYRPFQQRKFQSWTKRLKEMVESEPQGPVSNA